MSNTIFDFEEAEIAEDDLQDHHLFEIFMSDGAIDTSVDENGLIWKDVLVEGQSAYRPGPGQKPVPIPLKVVAGHATNPKEIGMQDLVDSFDDKAFDHVTIPTSHDDKPHENTGFVEGLKIIQREGKNYLQAGLNFTEKDIEGKALRGSIANTSVGVIFDYIKKSTGKVYKQALGHVALTNKPWITGMKPFGVAASEDEYSEDDIVSLVLADVVWDTTKGHNHLRRHVSSAISGLDPNVMVIDTQQNKALVAKATMPDYGSGPLADPTGHPYDAGYPSDAKIDHYVVPFQHRQDGIKIAATDKWIPASKEWVQAAQEEHAEMHFRDFTTQQRKDLAGKGHAMADGSFPIENTADLSNAVSLVGKAKNPAAAKAHVIKRAKALGATNSLPKSWKANLSDEENSAGSGANKSEGNQGDIDMSETKVDDKPSEDQREKEEKNSPPDPGAKPEKSEGQNLSEEARSLLDEQKKEWTGKLSEQSDEISTLKSKLHVKEVDESIEGLKKEGYDEFPGLLTEIRNLKLADKGAAALVLSEEQDSGDKIEKSLTASEVIDRILNALPKKENKIAFGDQFLSTDNHSKPASEPDTEDVKVRAAKLAEEYGVEYDAKETKDGE